MHGEWADWASTMLPLKSEPVTYRPKNIDVEGFNKFAYAVKEKSVGNGRILR